MLPFMIAGLVAVFVEEGGKFLFGVDFIGEGFCAKQDDPNAVPESVVNNLKLFHIPNLTTFDWLFNRIPRALFISSYPQQILVELEETDPVEFQKLLGFLPPQINSHNLGYINGPLVRHKYARAKCPDSSVLDCSFDDTNYLLPENGGALRSGVLECVNTVGDDGALEGNIFTNAGIKMCKGDTKDLHVMG